MEPRPVSFTVTHKTDRKERRRCYFRVFVWPSRRAYRERVWDGAPKPGIACWWKGVRRTKRGTCIGAIHLKRPDVSFDAIVHEAFHAIEEWRRVVNVFREESAAYGIDRLTTRILQGCLSRGIPVFLKGSRARAYYIFFRQRTKPGLISPRGCRY